MGSLSEVEGHHASVPKRFWVKVLGKLHKFADRRFDRSRGIETSKNANISEFESGDQFGGYAIDELYAGTPRLLFGALHAPLPDAERKARTYVDIGAGKGRMLIQAGEAGFTKLHGIEFVGSLAEQGRQNIAAVLGEAPDIDWQIEEADARTCTYPEGDLLVFLYNPFDPPVFEGFVDNLVANCLSRPRKVTVIYNNTICAHLLDRNPHFQRITYPAVARVLASTLNPHAYGAWKFVAVPE